MRPPVDLGGPHRDGEGVLWEVRDVPGKGKGVFALRDIQFGETIMVERPLQIIPHICPVPGSSRMLGRAQYYDVLHSRRSPGQQARFDTLFNCKKISPHGWGHVNFQEADSVHEGISRTNQVLFETIGDNEHVYAAVFAAISRVNHSCTPNTTWTVFSSGTFSNELCAECPIKMGQELTAAYCHIMDVREVRRKRLKEYYLFDCECDNCSLEGKAQKDSDVRRSVIERWQKSYVNNKVWDHDTTKTRKDLIQRNEYMIPTLEAEGMYAEVCDVYVELARAYVKYSDANNAQKYGNLALEAQGEHRLLKEGTINLNELRELVADPQSYRQWGYGTKRDKLAKASSSFKVRQVSLEEFMNFEDEPPGEHDFLKAMRELTVDEREELHKSTMAGMAAYSLSNPDNASHSFKVLNFPVGMEPEILETLIKGSGSKFSF